MNAVFRDEIGTFVVENVAQIVPHGNNLWSVMTTNYEEQEVKGEFVEAILPGY